MAVFEKSQKSLNNRGLPPDTHCLRQLFALSIYDTTELYEFAQHVAKMTHFSKKNFLV